jgi:hypothetical protein
MGDTKSQVGSIRARFDEWLAFVVDMEGYCGGFEPQLRGEQVAKNASPCHKSAPIQGRPESFSTRKLSDVEVLLKGSQTAIGITGESSAPNLDHGLNHRRSFPAATVS